MVSLKFLTVSPGLFIVTLLISLANSLGNRAIASQPLNHLNLSNIESSVCYLRTSDHLTLNLDSLCGKQSTEVVLTKDHQFMAEYLGLLASSPTLDPQLIQVAQANPRDILEKAAIVCDAFKTGKEGNLQVDETLVDRDILVSLATEHFCQEFAD